MLFDTHAHLDDKQFDNDREQLIAILNAMGVSYVANIGSNLKTSETTFNLAQAHDCIFGAVGVHPHYADEIDGNALCRLEKWTQNNKIVAIGEIGLDYHYNFHSREIQQDCFKRQMELAEKLKMPVSIHDREAHEDCLKIISEFDVVGIFHCFSGSVEMAKIVLDKGYYIAFGGTLTFKNAKKAIQVAEFVPQDRMLIETDCPYLAPEGFRGKRNNPTLVREAAKKLAEIKNMTFEQVAEITTNNAKRIFGL